MSEANGECIHGMESKPLFFEQVLVSEDGEPIYIEEGDDYGVFNEEEYIRLEDGTFMANQHPLVSQSQSSQPSEPQMLQVQMAPIPQRMSTEPPRSQQFEAHHPIHQQQTYPPARLSHVSRYKSNLAKTPTVKEEFPRNVPQQSFELINTSNILSLPKVSSNISKPFTSTPSSSSVYQVPSTQTVSKPRKKPLPGQRKPDCHNNLEHGADRSKAIKQSLERNPNAFKPKIGVKSGKVDAERLHQKGCHCKKSGCLKNYCECFEAKVPCTSRCKCHGCQNTEGDRINRNDRIGSSSALMSLANAASSMATGSPSSPLSENDSDPDSSSARSDPRSYPWFYMTDEVIEAATLCLVAQAEESLSGCSGEVTDNVIEEMERMVLGEFGRCIQEIISNASETSPALRL